jgi:hypothetical protein
LSEWASVTVRSVTTFTSKLLLPASNFSPGKARIVRSCEASSRTEIQSAAVHP